MKNTLKLNVLLVFWQKLTTKGVIAKVAKKYQKEIVGLVLVLVIVLFFNGILVRIGLLILAIIIIFVVRYFEQKVTESKVSLKDTVEKYNLLLKECETLKQQILTLNNHLNGKNDRYRELLSLCQKNEKTILEQRVLLAELRLEKEKLLTTNDELITEITAK